jgi:hypothetical protein
MFFLVIEWFITSQMLVVDPTTVRLKQRVADDTGRIRRSKP